MNKISLSEIEKLIKNWDTFRTAYPDTWWADSIVEDFCEWLYENGYIVVLEGGDE